MEGVEEVDGIEGGSATAEDDADLRFGDERIGRLAARWREWITGGLESFDGKFGMLDKEVGYCLLAMAGNCSSQAPSFGTVSWERDFSTAQLLGECS